MTLPGQLAKLNLEMTGGCDVNEKQVERLCQIAPKYGLTLEHQGLIITKVNEAETSFDAGQYMPDQFIDLLAQMIATKMKADLWQWQ